MLTGLRVIAFVENLRASSVMRVSLTGSFEPIIRLRDTTTELSDFLLVRFKRSLRKGTDRTKIGSRSFLLAQRTGKIVKGHLGSN